MNDVIKNSMFVTAVLTRTVRGTCVTITDMYNGRDVANIEEK